MSVDLRKQMAIDDFLSWQERREFRWNDVISAGFTRKGIIRVADRLIAADGLLIAKINGDVPMTELYAGAGLTDQAIAIAG